MSGDYQGDDAEWTQALDVLCDVDRIELVREIFERGSTSVYELAKDAAPERAAGDATVELHHRHLPVLDDAGWVHYDRDSGRVEPSDPDAVRDALDTASSHLDAIDEFVDELAGDQYEHDGD